MPQILQNVGVDHGGLDVCVTQQLLNLADIDIFPNDDNNNSVSLSDIRRPLYLRNMLPEHMLRNPLAIEQR